MSSDMATANAEFKVVQKRSSNQGRRGMSRERFNDRDRYGYSGRGSVGPRHGGGSGHTSNSEEPSSVTRKKTPLHLLHQRVGDKGDREIRLRPEKGRSTSGQSRSGNSSSSSSVGGGSGRDSSSDSYHHTGRHRSSSNSVDGDASKAAEKSITSPNRFEKLENLDPDIDDSVLEPSSSSEALKGSSSKNADTDKKHDRERTSNSGSGVGSVSTSSSAVNSRGRKGNVVYHHRGVRGHSSDPEMAGKSRNSESTKSTGKNNEQERESTKTSQDKLNKSDLKRTSSNDSSKNLENSSELNESKCTDTSLSMKNTSASTSGIEAGPSQESLSCAEEQLDLSQDGQDSKRKMSERTQYSRDFLLGRRKHSLCQEIPKPLLDSEILITDSARLQPLTTLSFLREYESKHGGGSSSQRRGSDPSSQQFDRDGGRSSSSSSRLARDHRQDWRQQRNSRRDYHRPFEVEEEPEPEWMEFGPADRFDVIELKGFDKHELEREVANDEGPTSSKGQPASDKETPQWEEEIVAENKDEKIEGDGEPLENGGQTKETAQAREKGGQKMKEDNEYILDGFDFSTGLSICQELALDADEEDEEGGHAEESAIGFLIHPEKAKTPVQLSNVLMKALKMGGDEKAESVSPQTKNQDKRLVGLGSRPVNALTLDEIQARENIRPMSEPSDRAGNDLGAFNKLVAVLQSSGDIKNEKGSPPSSSSVKLAKPQLPQSQHLSKQNKQPPPTIQGSSSRAPPLQEMPPVSRTSPISGSPNTNFGYLLEKELEFDEEATPQSKGPPPPPPQQILPPPSAAAAAMSATAPPYHHHHHHPMHPAAQPTVQQSDYTPPTSRAQPPPPPPTAALIGRGEPPSQGLAPPSMSRLEAIAGMLEKLDRSHLHTGTGYVEPNPPNLMAANKMRQEQQQRQQQQQQQQQQQLAMQMERERERETRERAYRYSEAYMDPPSHTAPSPELIRSMPPPPRQLPGVGGRVLGPPMPPSSGRPASNHWAVEIERRRVFELQQMQMRERERMFQRHQQQQMHGMSQPPQAKMMHPGPGSKPNISLLPTSVMRHIHNTKPNHPLSEMAKTSGASTMASRLDQELMMSKAQQSHSGMSTMGLNHSADSAPPMSPMEYPPTSQMMPSTPQAHAHPNAGMMYPHYAPVPQRMPSQHNPYMY